MNSLECYLLHSKAVAVVGQNLPKIEFDLNVLLAFDNMELVMNRAMSCTSISCLITAYN